jgi:hypothetical protein
MGKRLFECGLEFAKKFDFEIADFGLSGVNDNDNDSPYIFCVIVIALG